MAWLHCLHWVQQQWQPWQLLLLLQMPQLLPVPCFWQHR